MQWKRWSLPKNPLELAFVILKVLHEIENDGEYDPGEGGSSIVGVQCFFNALNSDVANNRGVGFILCLAAKVQDLIEDETRHWMEMH